MPDRTALLDTNALVGLNRDTLSAAQERGWHLTTSQWSFFERLRHLAGNKPFAEVKETLLRFQCVEIVDKPLDRLVAGRQVAAEPYIWGSDLVRDVLPKISEADSIQEFKRMTFEDKSGNERSLENSVEAICNILIKEKKRFQQLVTEVICGIRSGEVLVSTAKERHQAVLAMLVAGESSFRDAEALDYKSYASESEVLTHEYLYYAYILLRAIAQKKISGNTCPMNDFVDGQICAYVPLDQQLVVVTADKNSIAALREARSLLTDVGLGKRAAFTLAHPDQLRQGEKPE